MLAVRGFVLALLLGPEAFGVWTLFRIGTKYAAMFSLGIQRGLEFELARRPTGARRAASPGDRDAAGEARAFARSTLGFLLVVFGALSLGCLLATRIVADPRIREALFAAAASLVAMEVVLYVLVYHRARERLRRFAALEVLSAALQLVMVVLLALRWGLTGAFAGFALAILLVLPVAARGVPLRPALEWARVREMLRIGIPMILAGTLSRLLSSADRLVVAAFGGLVLLGHYAFGVAVGGLANIFTWVVRTVIFPEVYGRTSEVAIPQAVREHLSHTVLPFARIYPAILGVAALGVGPAIHVFVPQYAEAAAPARLFLFVAVVSGFAQLGSLGVVAARLQRWLPALSGAALVVNVGLSVLALRVGAGLEGVAFAALVGQGMYGAAVLGLCAIASGMARPVWYTARALFPLVYYVTVVVALGRLLPDPTPGSLALALLLYAGAVLPWLPRIVREARRAAVPPG